MLINNLKMFGKTKIFQKSCEITFKPQEYSIDKILNVVKKSGLKIIDLQTKDVNLEDVFISLTKD